MQAIVSTTLKPRHKQKQSVHVETTLYDVIEAVAAQVHPDEQYLLAPAVMELLKDCGAGIMFKGSA